MEYKILQIIPAPTDMCAIYNIDGERYKTPLTCLALIECEDDTRKVVGMDSIDFINVVEYTSNFTEYHRDNPLELIKEGTNEEQN